MRKILRGKLYGESVSLWGDGHQKRELVYLDDFVNTAIHLGNSRENDLINIGAGEEHSIRDFAREICNIVGYDESQISYDTSRYVGAKSKVLSVRKLDEIWPTRPRTTLGEGLKLTLTWFMQHKDVLLPRNITPSAVA
jgi:GDP-L-fucose synthase